MEDPDRVGIKRVDGEIARTADHELPSIGQSSRPALQREISQTFNGLKNAILQPDGRSEVIGRDVAKDGSEVRGASSRPPNLHGQSRSTSIISARHFACATTSS